ncbi:DDHD domain-containing protein 1 [Elsinoe fawcettii]|nr:DDHD domain-containing protein 1 [Elsinoe fawcettii]
MFTPELPPPVRARFFYTSPLAIDDPLSPVPPPASSSSSSKLPPRPFPEYDNSRLDEAWHELRRNILKYQEEHGEKRNSRSAPSAPLSTGRQDKGKNASGLRAGSLADQPEGASWGSQSSARRPSRDPLRTPARGERSKRNSLLSSGSGGQEEDEDNARLGSAGIDSLLNAETELPTTTGTPFIRAPVRKEPQSISRVRAESSSRPRPQALDSYAWEDGLEAEQKTQPEKEATKPPKGPATKVPVGVSRLHQVAMPELNLEPIYWAPVNDIAPVVRGTWFYKETMMPVEVPVANMLELGYVEMQAWTQTWQDELSSAVEVGAVGEERIFRKLWPEVPKKVVDSRPSTARGETANMVQNLDLEPDTPEKQRERAADQACDIIDVASGSGGTDNRSSGTVTFGRYGPLRNYAAAGVIYADATNAHILKPNLQPSSYYGRRPLANYIRKGRKLGIPVVRGFDQAAWDKLHPEPKGAKSKKAYAGASTNQAGLTPEARQRKDAELAPAITPKVTDLVLVIHGIGQKLSERMESFHFTHAMNGFRREVNVELGTDVVRSRLRKDAGGIMVLPVNWRHTLSFEEGGYRNDTDDPAENQYGLKDITPETLPSVRNIVSDVMLDIPYYLSHHQPKMISAVTREANRIYQLWCTNNPGFSTSGRVHILAHSLGSVMALDVLSKQPTTLPPYLSDPITVPSSDLHSLPHFLFPTSNVFFAGSPAGFFLLLKRAALRPRIDHRKPSADPDANSPSVCGAQGDYGCLPVDNIYNIINPYDPVSYRLNATVDTDYARSLKPAWLPSATPGWFASEDSALGGWFGASRPSQPRTVSSAVPKAATDAELSETSALLPRLPSNVELETHNFTREEIAEKRMFALNDNGQIDFMVRYGGGPLEIQYLTMLGAHSSYWLLKDFVRAVVVECGRESGREGTGRGMRARKTRVGR